MGQEASIVAITRTKVLEIDQKKILKREKMKEISNMFRREENNWRNGSFGPRRRK